MKLHTVVPIKWLILISLLLFIAIGCGEAAPAVVPTATTSPSDVVKLTVAGSEDVTRVLDVLSTAFAADVPNYRLKILSGSGIEPSIKGALEGILDVVTLNRLPNPDGSPQPLEFADFGKASVTVFTHSSIQLSSLTSQQLIDIFSGKVTNWSQVGGSDLPIIVYVRPDDDANTKELRRNIFGQIVFSDKAELMRNGKTMRTAVSVTKGGIGYGAWPMLQITKVAVHPIAIDNIAPDDSAYPMKITFGLGYIANAKGKVQPLIDWLRSPSGQAKLSEIGVSVAN